MSEKDNRVYELSFLLVPTISEENTALKVAGLKEVLAKHGASFISEDAPSYLQLAYPMYRVISNKKTKFADAYFGWVKFEIDPSVLIEIKDIFDRDEDLLRYLLISTVAESTLAPKKVSGKNERKKSVQSPVDESVSEPVEEMEAGNDEILEVTDEEVETSSEDVENPIEE